MTVATDLPREARAFLDALAVGESGGDDDPYHVLYGGGHFDETTPLRQGFYGFPEWDGKDNSHAAGRYQFEPATWKATAMRFDGETPDFRLPVWQDRLAWMLAQHDYQLKTGRGLFTDLTLRPLHVSFALHATWTSLNDQFPARYAAALAAIDAQNTAIPAPDGPAAVVPPEPQQAGATVPTAPAPPAPAPVSSIIPSARVMQAELEREGLYTAGVDGDWGPKSQAALAEHLRRQAAP